jgi:uncharacterized membrane protein
MTTLTLLVICFLFVALLSFLLGIVIGLDIACRDLRNAFQERDVKI